MRRASKQVLVVVATIALFIATTFSMLSRMTVPPTDPSTIARSASPVPSLHDLVAEAGHLSLYSLAGNPLIPPTAKQAGGHDDGDAHVHVGHEVGRAVRPASDALVFSMPVDASAGFRDWVSPTNTIDQTLHAHDAASKLPHDVAPGRRSAAPSTSTTLDRSHSTALFPVGHACTWRPAVDTPAGGGLSSSPDRSLAIAILPDPDAPDELLLGDSASAPPSSQFAHFLTRVALGLLLGRRTVHGAVDARWSVTERAPASPVVTEAWRRLGLPVSLFAETGASASPSHPTYAVCLDSPWHPASWQRLRHALTGNTAFGNLCGRPQRDKAILLVSRADDDDVLPADTLDAVRRLWANVTVLAVDDPSLTLEVAASSMCDATLIITTTATSAYYSVLAPEDAAVIDVHPRGDGNRLAAHHARLAHVLGHEYWPIAAAQAATAIPAALPAVRRVPVEPPPARFEPAYWSTEKNMWVKKRILT